MTIHPHHHIEKTNRKTFRLTLLAPKGDMSLRKAA